MGLDYKIINFKPIITGNKSNEHYIDLLSDTFDKTKPVSGRPIIINKHYVGRPDLVSLACYGDDSYGDIICKVNGISNPFELNEDDLIFIPDIEYITGCLKADRQPSEIIKSDNDDITQPQEESFRKLVSDLRSPNEQTINDRNYVIDKSLGIVFY